MLKIVERLHQQQDSTDQSNLQSNSPGAVGWAVASVAMRMGNVAIGQSGGSSTARRGSASTASSTGPRPTATSAQAALKADQNVTKSLMCVIDILNFVLDVRLDFRVTSMLSSFKEKFIFMTHKL